MDNSITLATGTSLAKVVREFINTWYAKEIKGETEVGWTGLSSPLLDSAKDSEEGSFEEVLMVSLFEDELKFVRYYHKTENFDRTYCLELRTEKERGPKGVTTYTLAAFDAAHTPPPLSLTELMSQLSQKEAQ